MFVVERSQCATSSEFGAFATTGPATTARLGLHQDAGDAAETGTGVELDGRVSYTDLDTGLSLEVASGRAPVAHEDSRSAWRRHARPRGAAGGDGADADLRPGSVTRALRRQGAGSRYGTTREGRAARARRR